MTARKPRRFKKTGQSTSIPAVRITIQLPRRPGVTHNSLIRLQKASVAQANSAQLHTSLCHTVNTPAALQARRRINAASDTNTAHTPKDTESLRATGVLA